MNTYASELCNRTRHILLYLNLFPSIPPSTDEYQLKSQRISTRLFIVLLILSLFILLIYTSLINILLTIDVKQPTMTEYLQLYSTYSQTLTCPCNDISIDYEIFIHLNYTLHQVCKSDFVTGYWNDYIAIIFNNTNFDKLDFRWVFPSTLQGLRTFCELINKTISNRLIQLQSTQYISVSVIPFETFQSQIQLFISQFITTMTNDFLLSFDTIRETTQINALATAKLSSYSFSAPTFSNDDQYGLAQQYRNCSCSTSSTCIYFGRIYNGSDLTIIFTAPYIYGGCYALESLLQSNLHCFYNQTCIDMLQSSLYSSPPILITNLNKSLLVRFFDDSTVEELINELMVEQWDKIISYENYYNACQTIRCTYTVIARNSVIQIVTTLLGLIGGLTTILKLIVPRLVKLIRRKKETIRQETEILEQQQRYNIIQKLKYYLHTLNLFPSIPPSTDEYQLKSQRISTRLFIILLILSLFILLLYTSLINVTLTDSIPKPTMTEYLQLYSTYSQTLTCPCNDISIDYEIFIHLNYTLNQVCMSDSVAKIWFKDISKSIPTGLIPSHDFRKIGASIFQGIFSFCKLINKTISNRLIQFHSTQYLTSSVTPFEIFQSQIQLFISQFITTMTNDFLLSFDTIRETTQSNALLSGPLNNYQFLAEDSYNNLRRLIPVKYNNCSCASSPTCIHPSCFYNWPNPIPKFCVPGINSGCYILESLLQSNLQCFYSSTCIRMIQRYLSVGPYRNLTALNISLLVRFADNSTIEELLNKLMVEKWDQSINYDNYYNACQPIQCTYTYIAKNNVIHIVTTLFGLIGGLITALKLIVPTLVTFIRKKIFKPRPHIVLSINERIQILKQKSILFIQNYNIFPSIPPSTDEYQLRSQRISTRLFIVLLILSLFILLLYTSLLNMTLTINVKKPTMTQYLQLYTTYSQALTCPCRQVSINYDAILRLEYRLHPICSSVFVTKYWIDYLSISYENSTALYNDFRSISTFTFQGLLAFCELINKTISNRLIQLQSTQYISASVIPFEIFQSQTQSFISQFILTMTNDFLLSLTAILETTQINGILSGQLTNYALYTEDTGTMVFSRPQLYGNCSCMFSKTCYYQSNTYDPVNQTILFAVPGIYTGCYIIESLLQSDLQCFYDQSCINELQTYFISSAFMNITAMDISSLVRFFGNSTIKELLDELMVEKWNLSINYKNYYNECQPIECTGTQQTKNTAIYIITTLVGLVGGLITALKLIAPRIVQFIEFCIKKCRRATTIVMPLVPT